MMDPQTYTIGQIAKMFDLNTSTLRYYEAMGLLDPVAKNKSGHRVYTYHEIRRLKFIMSLRQGGIPIEVIQEYVSLFHQGIHTVPERKALLEKELKILKQKQADLSLVITELEDMIANYEDTFLKREIENRKNPNYG